MIIDVKAVIEKLKSFDLPNTSDDEVIDEIRKIGKISLFGINIPKGHLINRSRCDREFTNWSYEKDISYIKDASSIKEYNRASFKNESIFYGCTPIDRDEHFCQALSIIESSKMLSIDSADTNEEYAIMGKWRVMQDFTIAAIAHHQDFLKDNTELASMHKNFAAFVKQFPEKENDFLAIVEFMSGEFAKKVEDSERYNYKISAAFSKVIMSLGVDGILYPSARGEGRGFNVALLPITVDKYLKLEKVAAWRIRKRNKNEFIEPYLFCDSFQSDGKFIWKEPGVIAPSWFAERSLAEKKPTATI